MFHPNARVHAPLAPDQMVRLNKGLLSTGTGKLDDLCASRSGNFQNIPVNFVQKHLQEHGLLSGGPLLRAYFQLRA